MRAAASPCKEHPSSVPVGKTYHSGGCDTPLCDGWSEFRCLICGWWITECVCGSCYGESKLSSKQEKAIYKRVKARNVADKLDREA